MRVLFSFIGSATTSVQHLHVISISFDQEDNKTRTEADGMPSCLSNTSIWMMRCYKCYRKLG